MWLEGWLPAPRRGSWLRRRCRPSSYQPPTTSVRIRVATTHPPQALEPSSYQPPTTSVTVATNHPLSALVATNHPPPALGPSSCHPPTTSVSTLGSYQPPTTSARTHSHGGCGPISDRLLAPAALPSPLGTCQLRKNQEPRTPCSQVSNRRAPQFILPRQIATPSNDTNHCTMLA